MGKCLLLQVILPLKHTNLVDLLRELESTHPKYPVYSFHNAYFMDSMADKADPANYQACAHIFIAKN